MQPLVVVVGEIQAPSAAYVVADDAIWLVTTPVKAIDVCFKSFQVFNAAYPAETHGWLLFQKLVYGIETKWDVKSTAVSSLLSDLNCDK